MPLSTLTSYLKPKTSLLISILLLATFLRFYHLSTNPPALYWDEASIGYNAFAILTRGIDEHGVHYPITNFLAYGDAKPPLYIYATSLSMAVFGVNEFAVRFPSALSGVIAVALTYFLVKNIFGKTKHSLALAQISSLLLAISPWHLQMSRAGFEANLALTLFLAGLLCFLRGLNRPKLLPISAIFWIATLYTFNAYRIFLPFFLVLLLLLYCQRITRQLKWSLISAVVAMVLVAPLIPFVLSSQAQLRFDEVTIFKNQAPVIEANLRQQLNHNALWTKVIYNRRVLYALDFLKHYTDGFKPDFLFFSGDENPRLSTRDQGEMYLIELPLVLIGLYQLLQLKDSKAKLLIIGWLLLAFIPAGVARETPHALRSLQVLPIPQILVGFGIIALIDRFSNVKKYSQIGYWLLVIGYSLSLSLYLETYYRHYPRYWSDSWQYGYKQLVSYIKDHQDQYDRIYITQKLGRPHTYVLFYLQYDPVKYVAERDAGGDPFGFTYTNSFGKYFFTNYDLSAKGDQKWLVVSGADAPPSEGQQLATISDPLGKPVFIITKM